jgi:hypothetical protein
METSMPVETLNMPMETPLSPSQNGTEHPGVMWAEDFRQTLSAM